MDVLEEVESSDSGCDEDYLVKVAFATPALQFRPSAIQNTNDGASEAEMRLLSKVVYSPIKPWQTRILRLQPGLSDQPLICSLVVAELVCFEGIGLETEEDLVNFEALSYSWGRPAVTSSITCNGIEVPVVPNLADALFHFRLQTGERLLWVDALCINQLDLVEKARQVEIMYDIFRKASRVLAWLGPSSAEHAPLLNLLAACPANQPLSWELITKEPHIQDHWWALKNLQHRGSHCKVPELFRLLDSFLVKTGYFKRQWVRQEWHAARDLQISCGPYTFAFRTLVFVSDLQKEWWNTVGSFLVGTPNTLSAYHILKADYLGQLSPLDKPSPFDHVWDTEAGTADSQVWTTLILESAFFDSTLPHDKIYAIVGMARAKVATLAATRHHVNPEASQRVSTEIAKLPMDYAKPISLVYRDVAAMLLRLSPQAHFMLAFRARERMVTDDFPSWFPSPSEPFSGIFQTGTRDNRAVIVQDFDYDELLITVMGSTLAVVAAEDALTHQHSFEQALAQNIAEEDIPFCKTGLRLYDNPAPPDEIGILHTICRRLVKVCRFFLVNLRIPRTSPQLAEGMSNLVALAPQYATAGDIVVELIGCSAFFLLRPLGTTRKDKFLFLGPVVVFYTRSEQFDDCSEQLDDRSDQSDEHSEQFNNRSWRIGQWRQLSQDGETWRDMNKEENQWELYRLC